MSNQLEKALYKAAVLTFEELGFMCPTSTVGEQQQSAPTDAAVSVSFQGPFNGRLVVAVCGNLLPTIAANMLGEESSPSAPQQRDALGEIANVICGNMLPDIAGAEAIFHIGPPQIVPLDQAGSDNVEPAAVKAHVGLDQGRADLQLFLSDQAALKE